MLIGGPLVSVSIAVRAMRKAFKMYHLITKAYKYPFAFLLY